MRMTKAFGDLASLHRSNITTSPIIHLAAQKTVERLFGPTDHRFVFVKRSVEHHRHASEVPEAFDEAIVARIGVAVDCLQAAGAIDMRDGWPNLEDLHHKRDSVALFEPFADGFGEDGWGTAKWLSPF